jgi:hypothetical protein
MTLTHLHLVSIEYVRNTLIRSLRHRQQIQSQTSIIVQQLANVQRSLDDSGDTTQ